MANNDWRLLVGFALAGFLVYLLAPVLMPFLVAALLAYLGDPLVDRLERYRMPRTAAVITVFVVILVIVASGPFVLLPIVQQQIVMLVAKVPIYIDWLQNQVAPWVSHTFGIDPNILDAASIKKMITQNWGQVGGVASIAVQALSQSGLALMSFVVNLVLVPVVTFYLLRDWDHMMIKIKQLLPRKQEPIISRLAMESDQVLGAFLRGQLLVMICLSTVYSVGLWIVGLDVALLIGLLAGTVSFVPYLGFIVGITLAGVATVMQFQDAYFLLPVGIVFIVGQALEGMLLTPLLVGDKIGLHPVAVIFAVMAGGQLFGFVGVLLALPAAAVLIVLLRYAQQRYTGSTLYRS